MDQTTVISLIAIGLSFATFVVIRLNRADEIADDLTYGDCPHVPGELRPARESGGGVSEQSGRAVTLDGRTHRDGGL